MAKKKKESVRDELSSILADNLNKKFKSAHKVAYFLDGGEQTPTDLDGWISTGSPMLDLAISNRPNGGLPVGRLTEITGLEGSGKSLLAAHAIADTQKKGGLGVYIDTENACNTDFLEAIGVDIQKMLYVPLETVEDIFEGIVEDTKQKFRFEQIETEGNDPVESGTAAGDEVEDDGLDLARRETWGGDRRSGTAEKEYGNEYKAKDLKMQQSTKENDMVKESSKVVHR